MLSQIISGVVIALVSFSFGYFLFAVQRKEAIRLELFRRRLDCYDKIMVFMEKVDEEVHHKNFLLDKTAKDELVLEIYNLTFPNRHYLSEKVYNLLEFDLISFLDELPNYAADLEWTCEHITLLIRDEVGSYIIDPKHIKRIIGDDKKSNPDLKYYENE